MNTQTTNEQNNEPKKQPARSARADHREPASGLPDSERPGEEAESACPAEDFAEEDADTNTMDDVIGYAGLKAALAPIIRMATMPDRFLRLGAELPHGILFHGEPGVGKTVFAKAFIKACGRPTFTITHTGVHKDLIREIRKQFDAAISRRNSIVLIDDMDHMATNGNDREEFAILQECIDRAAEANVMVVATVNDLDDIPDSLLRDGRFDRRFEMKMPTGEDATLIVEHYFRKQCGSLSDDVNFKDVADMLAHKSCATLRRVINEAAMYAVDRDGESISMNDIVKASLSSVFGVETACDETPKNREEVALHEAGHILIADLLHPGCVGFASLSGKRTNIGGFTLMKDHEKRRPHEILILLGGKAACEMRYGRTASGAGGDLSAATSMIYNGLIQSGTRGTSFVSPHYLSLSEEQHTRTETAMSVELDRFLTMAKEMVANNHAYLDALAAALLEKGYLLASDVLRIREGCAVVPMEVAE